MAAAGVWAPIAVRVLRQTFKKASNLLKTRLIEGTHSLNNEIQPILVRNSRQPIHPLARLRQGRGRGRWYSTHSTLNAVVRRFMSTGQDHAVKYSHAVFPPSATAKAVAGLTSRAPFASTLRPNLTGGTISRTSGGYSLGGGRINGTRYFSHTPAAPAQVVNNVSAAVRAFWLSGQKAQFDGLTPTGEKRYRSITSLQEETGRRMQSVGTNALGSFIDFRINPTVTALSPLGASFAFGSSIQQPAPTLNTDGFLDVLSVDFSRVFKDLAATMNDLKRLSSLGDLPITLEAKSILRVRFPGCDAETVERLCDEVGVQRGFISQDPGFDGSSGCQMALMFPFASISEHTPSSPIGSLRSQSGNDKEETEDIFGSPWLEGYETMEEISESGSEYFMKPSEHHNSSDYEGLEGIYRFLEQCDNSRRI